MIDRYDMVDFILIWMIGLLIAITGNSEVLL